MAKIKIIKPGLLTSVQDLGRHGYQQYGVCVSGAMDHVSARLANILLGNDEGEGLLELTMLGPQIEFSDPMVIAITGGDLQATINGLAVKMNRSLRVNSGDKLDFKGMKAGCRAYIAFAGGIDVPLIMGSKSTYTRGNMGGYKGRALKAGDVLSINKPSQPMDTLVGREIGECFYEYTDDIELRVVLGPQEDAFTEEGIKTFFNSSYMVTNECDRMGYRLEGEKVDHKEGGDIISDGIAMGAVQIPSHGQPIIMMADRQTTGGYTKIANVITVDLPRVAQAKPGDKISFKRVSLDEAHILLRDLENKIAQSKINCDKTVREILSTRQFKLKINGRAYDVMVEELKNY